MNIINNNNNVIHTYKSQYCHQILRPRNIKQEIKSQRNGGQMDTLRASLMRTRTSIINK